jgi:hypothetical protein
MAVTYPNATKVARMNAVVTQIGASGKIKFLTAADALLVSFTLAATAGTVGGAGVLTFSDNNAAAAGILNANAGAGGRLAKATVETSADVPVITGLTVGLTSTAAPAWVGSTVYTAGQFRTNGANQYRCTVGGTSASSGGPTGTGASIADGTVTWEYVAVANADFQIDNIDVTNGQAVIVNSATITHAA